MKRDAGMRGCGNAVWLAGLVVMASVSVPPNAGGQSNAQNGITPGAVRTDSTAKAAPDTQVTFSYGAFVDSYYAYDFGRPRDIDRPFTTQAVRHNEFNVNLAYVEVKASGARLRGRLALQAGTSVQSNYSGEPTIGTVSGPSLARFIQEAVGGYQLTPSLWVDAGIYFSHIGEESFISRDNLTYTRSLAAEYTPYYESGVKLTWQATPKLSALLTVVNGWQNISENNQDKGVGARLDYAATTSMSLSYYDFVGNEAGSGLLRVFNGVGLRGNITPAFAVQGNFDYGTQQRTTGGNSSWFSTALIGNLQMTRAAGISARLERYEDPDNVLVVTATPTGFKATNASVGFDISPAPVPRVLWRSEFRGTWATTPVFPDRGAPTGTSKSNALIVTSLALTF